MSKKEEIVKNLKVICATKLMEAKKENNTKKIEIYSIISDVLNTENAFLRLDMEIAVNMICDLVDDIEKAKHIYMDLLRDNK